MVHVPKNIGINPISEIKASSYESLALFEMSFLQPSDLSMPSYENFFVYAPVIFRTLMNWPCALHNNSKKVCEGTTIMQL